MIKKVNYSLVSAFGLLFIALGYIYLVFKIADITSEIDTKKNELTEFNLRVEKIKSELSEKEQKLEEAEKLLRIKQSLITEIDDRIESSTDKTLVRDIKNIITINQNFENAILNKIDFKESTTNKENVNSDIEKEQIPVVVEGFAYYGLFFDNEWEERHFNNLSRTSTDLPKVGDILEAITDVNIREGLIEVDDKTGKYINKKAIGLISKGDKIMVVKTHDVAGGPWKWIEFEKQ